MISLIDQLKQERYQKHETGSNSRTRVVVTETSEEETNILPTTTSSDLSILFLIKSFWCPKHTLPHNKHKIRVYAGNENSRSPLQGEATKIIVKLTEGGKF